LFKRFNEFKTSVHFLALLLNAEIGIAILH